VLDPLVGACGPRAGAWVWWGQSGKGHLEAGTSVRLVDISEAGGVVCFRPGLVEKSILDFEKIDL
jgi:hypothetical protein